MRKGEISPAAAQQLQSLARPLPEAEHLLLPTELFPLRAEVDRANASRLAGLAGPVRIFSARDSSAAGVTPDKRRRLLDVMAAAARLELKSGAQVMLVKNLSDALVNGSVGRVLGFAEDPAVAAAAARQKENSKRKKKKKEEDGGGDDAEEDEGEGGEELLPLVEFGTLNGKETVLVGREEFRAEDGEGKLLARRVQVRKEWPSPSHLLSNVLRRSMTKPSFLFPPSRPSDPSRLSMGHVHPQGPGPDHPTGQGEPEQSLRERCVGPSYQNPPLSHTPPFDGTLHSLSLLA